MSHNSPTRSWRIALAGAAMLVMAWPGVAAAQAPSISLGPVDCAAGGSVATVVNEGGGPARVTLLRDEVVVATMVVPATGLPVTQVVPVAEGSSARVDARYGDNFTSVFVRRDCSGAQAPTTAAAAASTTANGNAPFTAAPVIPATGVRAATTPATPTPVEAPAPAADAPAAPVNDPLPAWPFLLLAAAALLAAGAMASRMPGEVGAGEDRPDGRVRQES